MERSNEVKGIFMSILLLFTIQISAQTGESKLKIDSICRIINLKDTLALRIKVKYRNIISETEWQRFYVDTIGNKTLKVFTRIKNSKIGYRYYFIDQEFIKVEENKYLESKIIDSNFFYFSKKRFLFSLKSKPSSKKILTILRRAGEFLDYAKYVSMRPQ